MKLAVSVNACLYAYSFSSCGYGESSRGGIDGHQMQRASFALPLYLLKLIKYCLTSVRHRAGEYETTN